MTLTETIRSFEYPDGIIDCSGDEVVEAVAPFEARIAQLEADLAHKDAYYAQFTLVPKPTALENETKP